MSFTFFRFLLVGVANTILGLSVIYLLLHLVGMSYWMSTFLGNSVGAMMSYYLNRRFTFRSKNAVSKSLILFIIVTLLCYVVSYSIGMNLVEWMLGTSNILKSGTKTDLAVLISTGLYTVLNYLGQKWLVFSS